MKRELKFRVWNGMEMIYDVTVGKFGTFYVNLGDKGDGLDPKDSASLTPCNTKYPDNCPTMQFTGLFDKNGKEIYEGDIIDTGLLRNLLVEYSEKYAEWMFVDINELRWSKGEDYSRKVVGNIFETPESLTTKIKI